MSVLGLLLLVGTALTLRWGNRPLEPWRPVQRYGRAPTPGASSATPGASSADLASPVAPSAREAGLVYLRGLAVALVGGFWAGFLVTGPAVRLIMRLLAVTAGDDAQGRITEADEVVGRIELDGTIGLWIFGGILPGLLSGAVYLLLRRWLPGGRLAGPAFGALHLLIVATRVDPLRPDNPDFDIVGPGWLAVTTFGLAAILHGMAVVAFANRFSIEFPPRARARTRRVRALLPLVPPVLLLVPGAPLLLPATLGLVITVLAAPLPAVTRAVRSRAVLVGGRVALAVLALAMLPGAVVDARDIISRDGAAAPADPTP